MRGRRMDFQRASFPGALHPAERRQEYWLWSGAGAFAVPGRDLLRPDSSAVHVRASNVELYIFVIM